MGLLLFVVRSGSAKVLAALKSRDDILGLAREDTSLRQDFGVLVGSCSVRKPA